jgi:ribokinase
VFLRDDEFDPKCEGDVCYAELPLGAKLDIEELHFATGGNATNVAVTLARQGLHAQYVWGLGHDPASEASLKALDKEGVDTSGVVQDEALQASYSTILIAKSGERTIMNYHGALPTTKDVERLLERVEVPDWVYPTALGSVATLERVVDWAEKNHVKIMLNPAGSELGEPMKLKGLLENVSVLCLNKEEIQSIVEGETLEELVRHGLHYCPVVIVSDGPNGVCASDGKTIVTAGMYEDVPVIDRTGAGDAFASGFLSKWLLGESLKESIVFASANSTSVVSKIGAKEGILHAGVQLHNMDITEKEL